MAKIVGTTPPRLPTYYPVFPNPPAPRQSVFSRYVDSLGKPLVATSRTALPNAIDLDQRFPTIVRRDWNGDSVAVPRPPGASSGVLAPSNPNPLQLAPPTSQPKISDRVGQPPAQSDTAQPANSPGSGPVAAVTHTGWIVQVGALESESEARARIDLARNQARGLLGKADPFTDQVVAQDNRMLFRARFAGLERDQAEEVCRTLKRADISCITVRN
jgi:D-alanyl-D-alanine carboxypeptidase